MNNNELFKYFGTKIIVKWEHEVGDPKRKHKKKRIAKKWLKRYGTWQECDGACRKGYAIYAEGVWFVSSLISNLSNRFFQKMKKKSEI